ncbi:MAG: STAS domain-containing protein [Solirubrobacteraceae bacterium]
MSSLDSFSVQSERNGGTVRLMPTGELDIASVPDFELSFDAAVGEAPDAIVVDLSQLTFIDSTGLRALLSMSERYKGDLGLTLGSPAVERIIDITGTRGQLPLIDG